MIEGTNVERRHGFGSLACFLMASRDLFRAMDQEIGQHWE
jgi:hypothetical protein